MSTRHRQRHVLLAAASILLWLGCLVLYTRANRFPYTYHPDEEGKAKQVLFNRRNFNHPQLLLETTQVVSMFVGAGGDVQRQTEIGRWVSAGVGAGGVVGRALGGGGAGGGGGGVPR